MTAISRRRRRPGRSPGPARRTGAPARSSSTRPSSTAGSGAARSSRSFLSPVLFLAAMGIGLGSFVDRSATRSRSLGGVSYARLPRAGTAGRARGCRRPPRSRPGRSWAPSSGTGPSTRCTPRRCRSPAIVFGQLAWVTARLTLVATAFFAGDGRLRLRRLAARSSWASSRVGPHRAGLRAPITAFSAGQKNDSVFATIFRFLITPLFLFSGTFFPIEQLPLRHPADRLADAARSTASRWPAACRWARSTRSARLVHLGVLALYIVIGTACAPGHLPPARCRR